MLQISPALSRANARCETANPPCSAHRPLILQRSRYARPVNYQAAVVPSAKARNLSSCHVCTSNVSVCCVVIVIGRVIAGMFIASNLASMETPLLVVFLAVHIELLSVRSNPPASDCLVGWHCRVQILLGRSVTMYSLANSNLCYTLGCTRFRRHNRGLAHHAVCRCSVSRKHS